MLFALLHPLIGQLEGIRSWADVRMVPKWVKLRSGVAADVVAASVGLLLSILVPVPVSAVLAAAHPAPASMVEPTWCCDAGQTPGSVVYSKPQAVGCMSAVDRLVVSNLLVELLCACFTWWQWAVVATLVIA